VIKVGIHLIVQMAGLLHITGDKQVLFKSDSDLPCLARDQGLTLDTGSWNDEESEA
jgi:hypothetical protein